MNILKNSAMRFNLILASIGAFILMLSIALFIIVAAFKGTSPDWTAMGVFAIGLASILTGVSFTKAIQKKTEEEAKINEKNI